MIKRLELLNLETCLNKAAPDEPIFVLRAEDAVAAQTVRLWATMAFGLHEPEKIWQAMELANEMDKWRSEHQAPVGPEAK